MPRDSTSGVDSKHPDRQERHSAGAASIRAPARKAGSGGKGAWGDERNPSMQEDLPVDPRDPNYPDSEEEEA
jgi:hypothetical protein